MEIGRLCKATAETIGPDEDAREAARRMRDHNTGSLIVVDEHEAPVGIVTDRDLAVRVLGRDGEVDGVRIRDIMTEDLETAIENTSLERTLEIMRTRGVRRLPLINPAGRLVGLVSLDDILVAIHEDLKKIAELLRWATPMPPALSL